MFIDRTMLQGAYLDTLGEQSTQRIHEASLDVLENVGFKVHSPELLRSFESNGAPTDDSGLVFLPREIVLQALSTVPSELTLWHRNGKKLALTAGNYVHGLAEGSLNIWDFATGKHRSSTRRDVAEMTRLADALPNLDVVSHPVHAGDASAALAPLYNVSTTLANTTKHCTVGVSTAREFSFWVELAEILNHSHTSADKPTISVAVCTLSPLQIDKETAEIIMLAARKGIPVLAVPAPMAGATSPVTAAGTLLVQNAEALFLITAAQMLQPGLPVIYGGVAFIMDLYFGVSSRAIEHPSWISATAAMGRFYRLPSYVSVGANWTSSPDSGAGIQKVCYHLAALMSGVNLTLGAGRVEFNVMSYEQLVIDDALVEILHRLLRGIDIKRSDSGWSELEEAAMGGDLDEYALHHPKSDNYQPRCPIDVGALRHSAHPSLLETAHQRVEDILQSHQPAVTRAELEAIEEYVRKKEKELSDTQ